MSIVGGEKPEDRQRRIDAARAALAARQAADPAGVAGFAGRMAKLEQARKRERDRVETLVLGQGDPRPAPPVLRRPAGMAKQVWKAESDRRQRAFQAELAAWNVRESRRGRNAPPAEQMEKAPFVEAEVHDGFTRSGKPIKIGKAFCRQARFETFEWLTVAQITALRRYRRAFDVSELSPVKSVLDIGAGGGAGGSDAALARVEALAFAGIAVERIEAMVPPHLLPILRSVALYDADFKAVSIARYGTASGSRRARVRHDFTRAVDAMVAPAATQPAPSASAFPPAQPAPPVDPAYLTDGGYLRPMSEIVDIIHARFADEMEPT